MMAFMNPQQYQQWISRGSAPTGWQGAWPPTAPAGYPGPPPPPQGMKIDPKMWYSGQWQFNPMYPSVASAQAQAWAPHPMWQQQAVEYNPYKRKPNPGDATYWATKLSDNPLQLHNMHIRTEDTKDKQGQQTGSDAPTEAPQTPWVWAPRALSKSPERHDQQRDPHDGHGVRDTQGTHSSQQRPPPQQQPQPRGTHPLTDGLMAILRSKREWSAEDQHNNKSRQAKIQASHGPDAVLEDHRRRWEAVKTYWNLSGVNWALSESQMYCLHEEMEKEMVVYRPHQRQPSGAPVSVSSASQQQQAPTRETRPPAHSSTTSSAFAPSSAPAAYRSTSLQDQQARAYDERRSGAPRLSRRASDDNPAFTSNQQLQPTFSPSIVRTPQHYSSSASAAALSSSSAAQPTTPARSHEHTQSPPRAHGPIYGPPVTSRQAITPNRSNSDSCLNHSSPSRQSSSSSTHSSQARTATGPSPLSYLPTFSDEPASGLLSPLVTSAPGPIDRPNHERSGSVSRSGRELTRAQTVPHFSSDSTFPPIPEERSPPSSRTPRPSPHHPPSSYYSNYRDDASTPTPASRRSPGDSRTLSRSQTMPSLEPHSNSSSRVTSPVPSPTYPRSRSPPAPSPNRSRGASPLRNPLPSPPMPSSYPTSYTTAALSSMSLNGPSRSYSQPAHQRDRDQQFSSTNPRSQSLPQPPAQLPHASRPSQPPHSSAQPAYASRPNGISTASSSAARAASHARQESRAGRRHVRYGYWNKRGDYLFVVPPTHGRPEEQFIVYAPRESANPPELQDYPLPTQGFMNHHGDTRKYDANVPELPESLPVHGERPMQPYESFVRYVDE